MPAPAPDDAFAERARELGLVTPQQLDAARQAQAEHAQGGVRPSLVDMLTEIGALTDEKRKKVETAVRAASPGAMAAERAGFVVGAGDSTTVRPGEPTPGRPVGERTLRSIRSPAQGGATTPDLTPMREFLGRASRPVQDLAADKLLLPLPRVQMGERVFPGIAGIPLLAKLGQGGMGAVYYGVHPRLGSELAIKVLPFHLAEQQPEVIHRFLREARIAANVLSPHLVQVTDVNEECGIFYLIMEFIRGQSAGEYTQDMLRSDQPGAPETVALDICIAAAKGLAAAHAAGAIHRDIKPANIMIPFIRGTDELAFRDAKLADLGLARVEDREEGSAITASDSAMGTPGYMAPEQASDPKGAGKPADVFSLGATLYTLLTLHPPFSGSTPMQTMLRTIREAHGPVGHLRADVSSATARLIDLCLAKEPGSRYPEAEALLAALTICREKLSGTTIIAAALGRAPGERPRGAGRKGEEKAKAGGAKSVRLAAGRLREELAQREKEFQALLTGAEQDLAADPPRPEAAQGKLEEAEARGRADEARGWPDLLRALDPPLDVRKQHAEERLRALEEASQDEALQAQASLEVARAEFEQAATELKRAAQEGGDAVLGRLKVLCEQHVHGGPRRKEAEKQYRFGKSLLENHRFNEARKAFAAGEAILGELTTWRAEVEKVLREEPRLREMLADALSRLDADERSSYAFVEDRLGGADARLEAGDVAGAGTLLAEVRTGMEGATRAVTSRREALSAQAGIEDLTALHEFAQGAGRGKEAFAQAEREAQRGAWEEAEGHYRAARAGFEGVLTQARGEVGTLLALAKRQHKLRRYDAALKTLGALLQAEPHQVEALTLRELVARDKLGLPKELILELGGDVKLVAVLMVPGKFTMGSAFGEKDRKSDEGPAHQVTISKPFYMGKYEVTQEQYERVMGRNPSSFKGPKKPVQNVSWHDAAAFCQKVGQGAAKLVRLPTEAEWEYACRAGTQTRFLSGDDESQLSAFAWHDSNSDHTTHPVGWRKPNGWGLCDMHGNVWEWCLDWHGNYEKSAAHDPQGPVEGEYRVLRGGSCFDAPALCRSASRIRGNPVNRDYRIGFRVVVVPPEVPQKSALRFAMPFE